MSRDAEIIRVGRDILPKLEYLLQEPEASLIKKELEKLLALEAQGVERKIISEKIYQLLSTHSIMLEWMEEHLPDNRVRSARPVTKAPPPPAMSAPESPSPEKPENQTPLYPVWYGTNRKPVDKRDLSKGFANDRAGFGEVFYGKCMVSVPKSHRFGEIGRPWWKRLLSLDFEDDNLRLNKIIPATGAENFWENVKHQLLENPMEEREALVFLHGYNNSFEESAIRAAQIGFDLKVPGVTAFFSWPSKDNPKGYSADEATIQSSEEAITNFLLDFTKKSWASRIHLVAHSMGNRGLIRALKNISHKVSDETKVPFGQIILAAPDLDVGLFRNVADVYPQLSERTTLYVSPTDKAVGLSRWLHDFPRVGIVPPVTVVEGIDTIEVNIEGFNLLELGHSYFAEAEGVLHDMFDVLRRNSPPDDRLRLKSRTTDQGDRYWLINT